MILKKAWGEVTEQTIRNCFWKSGISLKAQEGAMDDPFKRIVDDGDDDSAVDKLECDLTWLQAKISSLKWQRILYSNR